MAAVPLLLTPLVVQLGSLGAGGACFSLHHVFLFVVSSLWGDVWHSVDGVLFPSSHSPDGTASADSPSRNSLTQWEFFCMY